MRWIVCCGCLILAAGCSSAHKHDLLNSSPGALATEEVLLIDSAGNHAAQLDAFLREHPRPNEFDKIDYLLMTVRNSKCRFIRNHEEYDSAAAARWLRWKMHHRQYKDDPIVTVRRFVDVVSKGSVRSGIPYEIITYNGLRRKLQDVFSYELLMLENALREKALLEAINQPENNEKTTGVAQEKMQAAILLPASAMP